MIGFRTLYVLASMAAAHPAVADTLPFDGSYGNEAGCRFAASGEYEDDSLLLLTPEEVSTFATGCMFTGVEPQENGAFMVDVQCSHEGEEYKTANRMRIERAPAGQDAYAIFTADGEPWGTVGRCP